MGIVTFTGLHIYGRFSAALTLSGCHSHEWTDALEVVEFFKNLRPPGSLSRFIGVNKQNYF